MDRVQRWWRRPDRFEWLSGYLDERRMQKTARITTAGMTALFSAEYTVMQFSRVGPHELWVRIVLGATALGGFVLAALWLRHWPTRNQSVAYVVGANVGVAVACLSMSTAIVGLSGSFAFIVVGFYGALFHGAKATLYNVVIALAVGATLVWRSIEQGIEYGGDAVLAGCEFAVLAVLVVGSPWAIATMLRIMAADIARSDFDALTGLLNRRGFYRQTSRLIDQHATTDFGHLTIAMIDLDNFKRINDDHGHAAGDRALIDVSHVLMDSAGPAAVVARSGGEEFLVADVTTVTNVTDATAPAPQPFAARLCEAVADTPHDLTASVGSVIVPIAGLPDDDRSRAFDELIADADTAMYVAKAAGGNRHHPHRGEAS